MLVNTPGTIPSLTIGGRVFTDLSNLKILIGSPQGAANSNSNFRRAGLGVYVVPAGKTFRILAYKVIIATAGTMYFGFCDNDVGVASATAPTNATYPVNNSVQMLHSGIANTNTIVEFPCDMTATQNKYLFCSGGGGTFNGTVFLFGYEI